MNYLLIYKTLFLVVTQGYMIEVHNEQVVLGNDVMIICKIPSLIADLVDVVAWVDNQGSQFLHSNLGNSPST